MIELLCIHNIAIVEEAAIELQPGLTVITGETGTGKSILMESLKLALGERASTEMIRSGAKKASVEAVFSNLTETTLDWLNERALQDDDSQELIPTVILRRELNAAGQSRAYINHRPVPLTQLKELSNLLIDIHGQHDGALLFGQAHQLRLLDSYGSYNSLLVDFAKTRAEYRTALAKLNTLKSTAATAMQQRAFLEFQINEIDAANLRIGEEAQLITEHKKLVNAEHIMQLCAQVQTMLCESENDQLPANTIMAMATKQLNELARIDPEKQILAERAQDIRIEIEELVNELRSYSDSISTDQQTLEAMGNRLQMIADLKKKYGGDTEAILEFRKSIGEQLDTILNYDSEMEKLNNEIKPLEVQLVALANKLSEKRIKTAADFAKRVTTVMRDLSLPKAKLDILLTPLGHSPETMPAQGNEACEFMITINAGEEPKSLRKVASGGEISRIMLAIKAVLADKDEIQTQIFDEIDTGISGDAATKVGDKLAELGKSRQVIAITHLPQIAARAESHLSVEKKNTAHAQTSINSIDGEQRVQTIAAMIVGHPPDKESIQYARVLLQRNQTEK